MFETPGEYMDEEKAASKVVNTLSGKWTVKILYKLGKQPRTFTDISKDIENISNKMVSKTLNELEQESIIEKSESRKGYQLTGKGLELKKQVKELGKWMEKYDEEGKILIIEDDDNQAEIYQKWLKASNTEQVKPEKALEQKNENVKGAIMDRYLGQKNSDKFLKHLSKADIPVIICSGVEPSLEDLEMPFYNYIVKPVDKKSLKQTINQVKELSKEERNLKALKNKKELLESRKIGENQERNRKLEEITQKINSKSQK